jgi:dTDP-4-amino-4,6-dideoxygalactose transaminase
MYIMIQLSQPIIGEEEIKAVNDVLKSGMIVQ